FIGYGDYEPLPTGSAVAVQGTVAANVADADGLTIDPASWTNAGTVQATNGAVLSLNASGGTNTGTLESSGGPVTVSGGPLTNTGVLAANGSSTLNLDSGSVTINSPGILVVQPTATAKIAGSLLGGTTDAALDQPQGIVNLDGSGTSTIPQFLEAMS